MTETYQSFDPYREQALASFPFIREDVLHDAVERSRTAYISWRQRAVSERGQMLLHLAGRLTQESANLAHVMAQEIGKPIAQGMAEIEKCANIVRYFAEHGERTMRTRSVTTEAARSYVRHEGLGVIFGIFPWNYPGTQVMRFLAPVLLAGNSAVLKPAPNVPQFSLALQKIFNETLPDGLAQFLFLSKEQSAMLVSDSRIVGVSFTGSVPVGREIARRAGECLKPVVLELGGSDPFVVFEDADLELAVRMAARSRFQNCGQTCIAAKRMFVHKNILPQFLRGLQQQAQELKLGDPLLSETTMGPLARQDLRDNLLRQITDAKEKGIELHWQGDLPASSGFFVAPTILLGGPLQCAVWQEEIFGPVAAVREFSSESEVLELANESRYGLGASIWTRDEKRAERLIADLEVGTVAVNSMVHSDARLEFGGVKDSGFGRELGEQGVFSFVNHKSVWWE